MSSVLLIEDNLLLCKMEERQILSAFPDVSLRSAHNSRDALKAAAEFPPDAVVMDCRLPGCGCLDLLAGILEISPNAAIIIASADPPKDLMSRSFRNKIFDILEKPFEAEELIGAIQKAFREKDAAGLGRGESLRVEKIAPGITTGLPFDRHEMINILSGILVGVRAFEADLLSAAENSPAIRETVAEYVPKILKMVQRATAQVKQVKE